MANSNRHATPYLKDLCLHKNKLNDWGFFPMLRYVNANSESNSKLGYSISPKLDVVRIGQQPLLHFYPNALYEVKQNNKTGLYKVKNSYIGMLGINGPLPQPITEYVIRRYRKYKDKTFSEFLDVFNHRFLSLFYRAFADSQPTLCADDKISDPFKQLVSAFSGNKTHEKKGFTPPIKDHFLDDLPVYYSGLYTNKNKSWQVLRQLLQDHLHLKVTIEQFVGNWLKIPANQLTTLNGTTKLGGSSILGQRVYERIFNFNIVIGPMGFDQYRNIISSKSIIKSIYGLTKKFVGNEYHFNINIKLNPDEKQPSRLGNALLGRTSWTQQKAGNFHSLPKQLVLHQQE